MAAVEGSLAAHGEEDYAKVRALCTPGDDGFEEKYNKKGITVWMKSIAGVKAKMIRVCTVLHHPMDVLFDVIHDDSYRTTWDKSMIKGEMVYQLTPQCSIDYYASKSPGPLKNRDLVLRKSWVTSEKESIVVMNSVDVESLPPTKKFVRCISYITAHLLSANPGGGVTYSMITHFDPRGDVPKFVSNMAATKETPKTMGNFDKACSGYAAWKAKNSPDHKPWRNPAQMTFPPPPGGVAAPNLAAMPEEESEGSGGDELAGGVSDESPAESPGPVGDGAGAAE